MRRRAGVCSNRSAMRCPPSTGDEWPDRRREQADESGLQADRRHGISGAVAVLAIFLLGIGNFAMHKAVLESGHRLLGRMALSPGGGAGRITLAVEFAVLLAAMLAAANGWPAFAWGYFIYTLANGLSAWLILTGRV